MTAMHLILILTLGQASPIPPEIRAILEARRPMATSWVEWTADYRGNPLDKGGPYTSHYVTETVEGTVLETDYGDAAGIHVARRHDLLADPDTAKGYELYYTEPTRTVRIGNENWFMTPKGTTAQRYEGTGRAPWTLESAGVGPVFDRFSRGGFPPWSDERIKNLTTTRVATDFGTVVSVAGQGWGIEWHLSKEFGNQPTLVSISAGNVPNREAVTEYHRVGDRWLPKRVSYYLGDHESVEPSVVVEVHQTVYDDPDLRQEPFEPQDIGLVFGTKVSGGGVWNGVDGFLPSEEYRELIFLYGIDPDETHLRAEAEMVGMTFAARKKRLESDRKRYRESRGFTLPGKTKGEKDEWLLFTEAFIEKHNLPKPRAEMAVKLSDRSINLRNGYERKFKKEKRDFQPHKERIFERMLKRGLLRLLPRKHRPRR